jgi:hypothetical protein
VVVHLKNERVKVQDCNFGELRPPVENGSHTPIRGVVHLYSQLFDMARDKKEMCAECTEDN